MICPRCRTPGALVGIHRVDCLRRSCPCYHAPLRRQYEEASARREWLFSGDAMSWIRLSLLNEEREQARD